MLVARFDSNLYWPRRRVAVPDAVADFKLITQQLITCPHHYPVAGRVKFENIEIDASAMQLRVGGELVTTTATEFRLLDYLARRPGRVFLRPNT